MNDTLPVFQRPIEEGKIRIFLRIKSVLSEYENDAPDFVDVKEDHPKLRVTPVADVSGLTDVFLQVIPLTLDERKTGDDLLAWNVDNGGIWFDIEMDDVKEIWLSDFNFSMEGEKPRYISYYIKDVEHNLEWLQKDPKSGEIRSLSFFKKEFTPPPITEKEMFSGSEILKCADMLRRAIQKIDMRTHTAFVKFNTEKGRLNPLLIGLADKLGYRVEMLDRETIRKMEERGENVSHLISLK